MNKINIDDDNVKGYKKIIDIDIRKLTRYKYLKEIKTKKIILTYERKKHILDDHPNEYGKAMSELKKTLKEPDEIRVSNKDISEIHYIRRLEIDNHIVIVKLNINNDKKHYYNSIISSWILGNDGLQRISKRNKSIYKKNNR